MHYFFVEDQLLMDRQSVSLSEEDTKHAYRVLRLKPGEKVCVSDGRGKARRANVAVSSPAEVIVNLGEQVSAAESPLKISLFQSLAKGDKMDQLIRQSVELGVNHIVPIVTERSIPRWEKQREDNKLQRWRSIVRSAAAQCRRATLPQIEPAQKLLSVLPRCAKKKVLVSWVNEKTISLNQVLEQPCPDDRAVIIMIGPEGGFTDTEISRLHETGAIMVHLGPRIMRTETAAVATLVMVQAAWGDLSGKGKCN